jgi:hypothetical protein
VGFTSIVACRRGNRSELAASLGGIETQLFGLHADAGHRPAQVIGDTRDKGATTRQHEVNPFDELTDSNLDRPAGLTRPTLSVLHLYVPVLRRGNGHAPARHRGELEPSLFVGGGEWRRRAWNWRETGDADLRVPDG